MLTMGTLKCGWMRSTKAWAVSQGIAMALAPVLLETEGYAYKPIQP
jgi:hypothetical protein